MEFKEANGATVQGSGTAKTEENKGSNNAKAAKSVGAVVKFQPEPEKVPEPTKEQEQQKPGAATTAEPVKLALNLEQTLKAVETINRAINQRDNLLKLIDELEAFETVQTEDADVLDSNTYQGCRLVLVNSRGQQTPIYNPRLIHLEVENMKRTCYNRLAEIEAGIVFPN